VGGMDQHKDTPGVGAGMSLITRPKKAMLSF
jgi:hypothetical protein